MGPFEYVWKFLSHDLGMDLGTANTMVLVKGRGIIIREPSVVALNKKTQQVLAVGEEARRMIGRTPGSVVAVRPLKDGVISDFDTTEAMIRYFIRKVHQESPKLLKVPRPRIVVGIPSTVTEVEGRAVIDASLTAGARQAFLVEQPMAAAIGADLEIDDAAGSMIIDIGGGTTDIAVISLGGIVVDKTIRIAGDEMDEEIVNYTRQKYNLLIGEKMAEDVKIKVGSACPQKEEKEIDIRGRDLITGLPKTIRISGVEVREAILKPLELITEAVKDAIEETPPELLSDLLDKGIVVAGGGALLRGLDKFWHERLRLPVNIADDPMTCVVRGTGKILEEVDLLERLQITGEDIV